MATDVKFRLAVDGGPLVSQTIDGVTKKLEAMGGTAGLAKNMLGSLAAGLSVGAFAAYAKAAVDAADAMNDLSQRVGISVQSLAKYELAAAQSGTTMEALAKGIKGIAVNLAEHGDALRKAGISATTADGAMQQLADVFAAMPDGMEKTTLAVKLFGKSGMDLIPMLNLGSAGLQEAAEKSADYAKQMAILAPLADALNDNLATLATSSKTVGMAMINPFMPALVAITGQMAQAATQTGVLEAAIVGVGGALRVGWGYEIEIMMLKTRAWLNELEAKKLRFFGRGDEAGAYMNAANNDYNAIKNLYANDPLKPKPAAAVDTSSVDAALKKYKELMAAIGAASGAKTGIDEATKGLAKYNELMDKSAGFDKSWADTARQLRAALDGKKISQEQYNAAILEAYKNQPIMVAAEKAAIDAAKLNTEAVDDLFDAQEKLRQANEDQIKTGRTMLEQIEFETRLLGLNAEQRAVATMERELESQGIVKGTLAYDAYIAKLREAMALKSAKEAGIESTKELADANKKAAEESSKYWEDALMRAFESGKGFFDSLWSTIKNTLKTQVLKVLVTGSLTGGLGLTDIASAATGGSSGVSLLSSLANLPTAITGLTGSISSFASGFAATWTGGASGAAAFGTGYSSAVASGTGGSFLSGGSIATTLANPATWAVLGAVIVAGIIKAGQGETRNGGQYGYSMDGVTALNPRRGTSVAASGVGATFLEGPSGGEIEGEITRQIINGTVGGVNSLLSSMGSSTRVTGFQAGLESSDRNRGGVFAGGTLSTGATFGESGKGDNYAGTLYDSRYGFNMDSKQAMTAFGTDMKMATIEALQAATDIPNTIRDMLAGVDTKTLSDTAATALLTDIEAVTGGVNTVSAAFKTMPFESLKTMSFDATAGLLAAAAGARQVGESMDSYLGRGLQALQTNLSGFYDNFYSDGEKTSNLASNMTSSFKDLGMTMPENTASLKTWYRTQVEAAMAADQSVPANQQHLASLLALQGGVAQLGNSAETAAQQIAEAAARLQADIYSAQDDAMSAYMSAQADYAAIVAGEQEAAAQAMQAAAAASTQAADAIRSALASAGQGIATLIRDLTTTAGGTLDPMALARSTQAAYLDDLRRAQGGDVDASGRVAGSARAYLDASGAVSTNSRQAATVAQVVRELGQLPAVKTYEQQLLEAVQGTTTAVTTSSATNAATIAAALSTKLIAELSVTAQSEILKLINFVAITDQLPDDLKALALADASTMSKTISFVQGSTLTPENKQLALLTETSVIKTYNFVAASELTADQKQQAFGVLMSGDRVIRVVTGSLLSDDAKQQAFGAITSATRAISIIADSTALAAYKQTALEAVASATKWVHLAATGFSSYDANLISSASSSVTKAVSLALQNSDPWALTVLAAQDRTVSTILNASGGVLTMEQRTLLDGITNYNKNIQIGIKIDSSELSTFQKTLMSIFGTIDITGLAAAGVDLSGVISNEALARLQSVSTYVRSFDWVNTDLPTRASQLHAIRTTAIAYGVSSQDVATAIGTTKSELASWYAYLNVPFFATGGMHAGGLRIVGENGPELEVTGPSRIYNASDTMAMLRNPQANNDALVAEIRRLNATNEALERRLAAIERNTQAGAVHQADSADSLRNLKNNGVQVWTDPAEPLKTEVAA